MYSKIKSKIKEFKHWMAYQPPYALSSSAWSSFRKEFRQKAPIRYWIHHKFRRKYIYPVKWKYEKLSSWIRYRTTNRYHVLNTGLEPGYYDIDTKMLHVNFNLLKDFVEFEVAWKYLMGHHEEQKDVKNFWIYKHIPFVYKWFRSPIHGLKHLEWETTLDDPSLPPMERSETQAVNAREIIALYNWWVKDRPARVEIPFAFLPEGDDEDDIFPDLDRNSDEYKAFSKSCDDREVQSEKWDKEDDEMLIRLIKIRKCLWT